MENREDPGLDPLGISLAYEAPTNLHNSIDKGLLTADQNGRSHEDGFVSSDVLPQKDCAVGSDVTITPKSTIGMKDNLVTRKTSEEPHEQAFLSFVPPAALPEHQIPTASKHDQHNFQAPNRTGESSDTNLDAGSPFMSRRMGTVDLMPVFHPKDMVSFAKTEMLSKTVPSMEVEVAVSLDGSSNVDNHGIAKAMQIPISATTIELITGDTDPSPVNPGSSFSNHRSDPASLVVAGPDVETNLVGENPEIDARVLGISQTQKDSDSAGPMGLGEQEPHTAPTISGRTALKPLDGVSRSPDSADPLSRLLKGEGLPSSHEDAAHNCTEVTANSVARNHPSLAANVGNQEEQSILREDMAPSGAKVDFIGIDTGSTNSAEAVLRFKLKDMNPQDATQITFNSPSVMKLDSATEPNRLTLEEEPVDGEEAEYATDSSPLEDTSSESSSLSSSSEDSDGDYKMLDPEEQARILMLGDGGSDDDGGGKNVSAASKTIIKTQNERLEQIVEKPALVVTEEMGIEELGVVENLVNNIVLIKAKISGEFQVLEAGSVLCLKDRSVIGVVAETLGRVHQPLYSVLFTNSAGVAEAGIEKGSKIFYVVSHSTFVFTQAIKNLKGSDASNIHDEEVGDDDMEFSDDEAEAAYKRNQKIQREERRANLNPNETTGFSRPPRGRGPRRDRGRRDQGPQMNPTRHSDEVKLSYDDPVATVQSSVGNYDGPYIPLARPTSYSQVNNGELPVESERLPNFSAIPLDPGRSWRGRGRGGDRGPWRGRGRGQQRGSDHGSYIRRVDDSQFLRNDQIPTGNQGSSQYSPSANPHDDNQYPQRRQSTNTLFNAQSQNVPPSTLHSQNNTSYQHNQTSSQQNHVPQMSPSYSPQTPFFLSTSQQFSGTCPSTPYLPPSGVPQGAFINPAFFGQHAQPTGFVSSSDSLGGGNSNPGWQDAAYQAAQERLDVLRRISQGYRPQ